MRILNKIDDCREAVEDAIAKVLDVINKVDSIDECEKKLIVKGVKAGFISLTGVCPVADSELYKIADTIVEKGLNELNPRISKQLKKKNKKWNERAEAVGLAPRKTETPFNASEVKGKIEAKNNA